MAWATPVRGPGDARSLSAQPPRPRYAPRMATGDPPPEPVRWLDDAEQRAWRSVVRGTRELVARIDRDLRPHGLNGDDYGVLVALSEAEGQRLRMADLAAASAESRSRLSHHVGRLEQRGLVRRESCPDDRRGQFAVLTPAGRDLLERAAPDHVAGVREHLLDRLSPEELAVLGDVFGRLGGDATDR